MQDKDNDRGSRDAAEHQQLRASVETDMKRIRKGSAGVQDKELAALKALAEAAEKGGQHIYTHPRDSNKHAVNERWHRAASPEAFLSLIARIEAQAEKIAFMREATRDGDLSQPSPAVDLSGMTEKVRANMITAFNLGQNYWQQADSESVSQHKKAERTMEKFINLNDETCSLLSAPVVREGKMTDERIKELAVTYCISNAHMGSLIDFTKAVEREVLATGKGGLEPYEIAKMKGQAQAWSTVAGVLSELRPGWEDAAPSGIDAAVATVRALATPSTPSQAWEGELPEPRAIRAGHSFPKVYAMGYTADQMREAIGAAVAGVLAANRDAIREAVQEALASSNTYFCGRTWSAWQTGTMSEGDFQHASTNGDLLDEITDAAIRSLRSNPVSQQDGEKGGK